MSIELAKDAPVRRLTPPYDTGKVRVGLAYVKYQSWQPSRDMYALQTALLGPRSSIRVTWLERLSAFFSNLWSHRGHS